MKAKKIVICCIAALLLLLVLAAVYFFQFNPAGYRMSVPYRSSFVQLAEHIYINKNSLEDPEALQQCIAQAMDRDRAFFGDLQCMDATVIILCDDEKLLSRLGGDHDTQTLLFPAKRNYICISDLYSNTDIFAHELTHAELHTRLSAQALKRIPTWFDEGLAVQNDERLQYNEQAWADLIVSGRPAVTAEEMDTPAEFYAGDATERRMRYLCAGHEVRLWMETHQQEGLLALIDRLNAGADFDTAYAQ